MEITLPEESPLVGQTVGQVSWPPEHVLVAIIRGEHVLAPSEDDSLEAWDELLFITPEQEDDQALQLLVAPEQEAT